MSRYYIYDSVTDTFAEFANSYNINDRKSSRYRGQEGGRRNRPSVKGKDGKMTPGPLNTAEVRVTGSGQNAMGRIRRGMTKGGGLTSYDGGFATDQVNRKAFKKMVTKKGLGKTLAIGGGTLAAGGALAGGAYLMNRNKKKKAAAAQERSSIKGRVKRLLGR